MHKSYSILAGTFITPLRKLANTKRPLRSPAAALSSILSLFRFRNSSLSTLASKRPVPGSNSRNRSSSWARRSVSDGGSLDGIETLYGVVDYFSSGI